MAEERVLTSGKPTVSHWFTPKCSLRRQPEKYERALTIDEVARWLLGPGRAISRPAELHELSWRLVAAGIPFARPTLHIATLPSIGRIRHLHMVTTLSGATPVTEDEAIAEAKAQAGRRNADVRNLAVALSNEIEHGRWPHSIDPKTKAFVPLPGDG